MSSFLDQLRTAGDSPKLAATLERVGATSVDIRDPQDGSLALRTTVAALLGQTEHAIAAGDYLMVLGSGPSGVTTNVALDDHGRVGNNELDRLAGLITSKAASAVVQKAAATVPAARGNLPANMEMDVQVMAAARAQATVARTPGVPLKLALSELPVPGGPPPKAVASDQLVIEPDAESILVRARRTDRPLLLRIFCGGTSVLNAVLPAAARLRLLPEPAPDGPPVKLRIEFDEPLVDGLVELRTGKQFSALLQFAELALGHDLVVSYSDQRPGAAVLVGYALLRAERHALVGDILSRVKNRAAMEPDATIMLAECAARAGESRSAQALESFLAAAQAGIPGFSFGLSYMVERLRLFAQSKPSESQGLTSDANNRAKAALSRIEPFCMFADHSRIFVTYAGLEPGSPGPEKLTDAAFNDLKDGYRLVELPKSSKETTMADITTTITNDSQQKLVQAIKDNYPTAQGGADTALSAFCAGWPGAKIGLEGLRTVLSLVPGVNVFAGPAISIVIAAGDAAQSALCPKK